jgi:hypothetical protein
VNVPGFPGEQDTSNLLVSIQDIHSFNSDIANEARVGLNLFRGDDFADPAFLDTQVPYRIVRSTSAESPGFPIIRIAQTADGVQFGTAALQYSETDILTPTFADTISVNRGSHSIRTGFEFRYYLFGINLPVQTRGVVAFQNFPDFLQGITQQSVLANGITDRAFRAADYNPFVQDDWKISRRLTLNVGLRYELDLPAYDTRGRIATFDVSLYTPPATSMGPPGGLVQAGNVAGSYDVPQFANVGRRVLKSFDWNNLAPRVGLAFAPFDKRAFVVRAGYGIYYSRAALAYLVNNIVHPPFYYTNSVNNAIPRLANFAAPFPTNIPTQNQFPALPGALVSGIGFDRNIRTPYIQQFNSGFQFAVFHNTMLEITYVGSRGINLFRQVGINQARLAVAGNPINGVTTNTPVNAQARATFQGVSLGSGYLQDQSTAQSTYHSLQFNLTRRFSRGLQFQVSYTLSRSIDNASGGGGGAGTNGLTDTGLNLDTGAIIGDQLDNRANRGPSNFDRRHRFVSSFLWESPKSWFAKRSKGARVLFSGWQMAGIVSAMSGLPIDVIDSMAGSFYLGTAGGGGRPNFAPGATLQTATSNIPTGYYFNPFAFARPQVLNGQFIPSSNRTATANADGTDFGNVSRNILRGPRQFNIDLSIGKRFTLSEAKAFAFHVDVFNLLNTVNFANPISNLNAVSQSGGSITNTGQIAPNSAGDFGKIISTSNNPRIVQLVFKFHF